MRGTHSAERDATCGPLTALPQYRSKNKHAFALAAGQTKHLHSSADLVRSTVNCPRRAQKPCCSCSTTSIIARLPCMLVKPHKPLKHTSNGGSPCASDNSQAFAEQTGRRHVWRLVHGRAVGGPRSRAYTMLWGLAATLTKPTRIAQTNIQTPLLPPGPVPLTPMGVACRQATHMHEPPDRRCRPSVAGRGTGQNDRETIGGRGSAKCAHGI